MWRCASTTSCEASMSDIPYPRKQDVRAPAETATVTALEECQAERAALTKHVKALREQLQHLEGQQAVREKAWAAERASLLANRGAD